MQEEAKTIVDGLAVTGTVETMAGWLPPLASGWVLEYGKALLSKKSSNRMSNGDVGNHRSKLARCSRCVFIDFDYWQDT